MPEPTFNRPYGPVTLAELTAGLVWPRLFRAFVLSIRPSRVLLGTVTATGIWGVAWLVGLVFRGNAGPTEAGIPERVLSDIGEGIDGAARNAVVLDWPASWRSLHLAWTAPGVHLPEAWLSLSVFALIALFVWVVGGGAIARMAALDIAGDFDLPAYRGVIFSLRRWADLMKSFLIPLGAAAVISLCIRAAGWVLFSLPGLSVVGAVVYPLLMIGALLLILAVTGFIAGQALLVPAVAAESADAVDAVQRAYSYVLGRPGRLAVYFGLVIAQGAIALWFVGWLIGHTVTLTRWLGSSWLGSSRIGVVASPGSSGDMTGWLLSGWEWVAAMVVAGWAMSFYFCATTLVYLLIRRVCDEQDVSEVWMPGMVGGTMSKAEGRQGPPSVQSEF